VIALSVETGGPAGVAGLLVGDIITSIDGRPVADTDELILLYGRESKSFWAADERR
jgi:S1-C subfamily serine protease